MLLDQREMTVSFRVTQSRTYSLILLVSVGECFSGTGPAGTQPDSAQAASREYGRKQRAARRGTSQTVLDSSDL